jgi:hypothetical protein
LERGHSFSGAVVKITLDTNCLINLFDHNSKTSTSVESLESLVKVAFSGVADLAITTRVREDLENDQDEDRKNALLRNVKLFPIVGCLFRFDTSRFDSGDYWASGEDVDLSARLQRLLFPTLNRNQSDYKNKIHDIDHLIGHAKAKRDIFVTNDKGILKKHAELNSDFGIIVMTPDQAVAHIHGATASRAV